MSDETQKDTVENADPVLSEDEVDALLSGVESGEIEVASADGPRYARVLDYEIPKRSRILTRALPKLEILNGKVAERLRQRTQKLLSVDVDVEFAETDDVLFGELIDRDVHPLIAVEFSMSPLPGAAALVLDGALVHRLVELFFGGADNAANDAAHGKFSPGVIRVIDTYTAIVLEALKVSWERVSSIEPRQDRIETALSLLSIADETDRVIRSTFEISFGERATGLTLLMPRKTLASLLPLFKGSNATSDPDRDREWSETIRASLPDVSVDLSTRVGEATLSLGQLITLQPGDIINIDSPTVATILAKDVRLLDGRFGVCAGKNAVAATHWISSGRASEKKEALHG